MSKNFKPGDLALIIKHSFPPAVGRCVELVEFLLVKFNREDRADPYAYEDPNGEPAWVVAGCNDVPQGAVCLEKNLMPLHGDFQPEQQMNKEAANG